MVLCKVNIYIFIIAYLNEDKIKMNVHIIFLTGYTIMHPSFTRPIKTNIQPMHTDIWHFENNDGFARIRSDMIK